MNAEQAVLVRWADVPVEAMSGHIDRQYLTGTGMTLARVVLKKGAHVREHSHANEQIAVILEGALRFLMPGREVVVRAGEVLCLPPDVPHEVFALEDTVNFDVFNPPRQDWVEGKDAYLREGAGAK